MVYPGVQSYYLLNYFSCLCFFHLFLLEGRLIILDLPEGGRFFEIIEDINLTLDLEFFLKTNLEFSWAFEVLQQPTLKMLADPLFLSRVYSAATSRFPTSSFCSPVVIGSSSRCSKRADIFSC